MDFQKYLKRFQFTEEISITLKTLQQLQKKHLLHIPFENLDIHIGEKIELDILKIYEKIIIRNRGGFCYELNGLFYQLLSHLGFTVKMISANVYNEDKKKYGPEFDHLALLVNIDGKEYLTDVGFGEFTFYPLEFDLGKTQVDTRGDFLIDVFADHVYRVNQVKDGKLIPQYIFKKESQSLKDFETACLYQQTSPDSHFTKKKIISRPIENGRITLASNLLKIKKGEITEDFPINNEHEFVKKLWEYFHIKL